MLSCVLVLPFWVISFPQILLLIKDFIGPPKLNDSCHEYLLAINQSSAAKRLTKQRLKRPYKVMIAKEAQLRTGYFFLCTEICHAD